MLIHSFQCRPIGRTSDIQVQWRAWAQELNVLGLAITEMVSKIHTVGTNYSTAESANVRDTALAAGDKADLVFSSRASADTGIYCNPALPDL